MSLDMDASFVVTASVPERRSQSNIIFVSARAARAASKKSFASWAALAAGPKHIKLISGGALKFGGYANSALA
eukprot:5314566-Karenia_brevis.AAC.1